MKRYQQQLYNFCEEKSVKSSDIDQLEDNNVGQDCNSVRAITLQIRDALCAYFASL